MKIIADTHAHTTASGHAYSTISEMTRAASDKGLRVLALTEHAPAMPGTCCLLYFANYVVVPRERYGVHLLLGAEANILDEHGTLDLPDDILANQDIVLVSIHSPCFGASKSIADNTKSCIRAMRHPHVNIIAHPDDANYPLDYDELARAAAASNVLLEVNSLSFAPQTYRLNTRECLKRMLECCEKHRTSITLGSDAHVDANVADFKDSLSFLAECSFPKELVAGSSIKSLADFIGFDISKITDKI
ncbi:MAG: phosphatase [Oscillospiraceae bacterium]